MPKLKVNELYWRRNKEFHARINTKETKKKHNKPEYKLSNFHNDGRVFMHTY